MDGYFLIINCEGSEDPPLDVDFKEGPPLDRELMKIQRLDHNGHDVRVLKSHHWVYGSQGARLHNVVKAPPVGRCKKVQMALQGSEGGPIGPI